MPDQPMIVELGGILFLDFDASTEFGPGMNSEGA
jgi:hypothetical protein